MKLVLGIAGASGSIYPARFLKKLLELEGETYLIVSPASIRIFREEYETNVNTPQEILDFIINKWQIESIRNQIHFRTFADIGNLHDSESLWQFLTSEFL